MCLDLGKTVAGYGVEAIKDAIGSDPFMKGKNATAFKAALPVAIDICLASQKPAKP